MTVGSLFSGFGGIELGLERAGFEIVWQVEKDEYCQKVLRKNFPETLRLRDIRDAGARNLPRVDLICGGFPCQPFSHAGKRGGTQDDRYLWPEMLRVIKELQPTWIIGENVPGILSMELSKGVPQMEGKTISEFEESCLLEAVYSRQDEMLVESICQDVEEIGYEIQTIDIPACGVDAWHIRHRIWFLGYSNGQRKQQQLSIKPQSRQRAGNSGEDVSDTQREQFQRGRERGIVYGAEEAAEGSKEERERVRDSTSNSSKDVSNANGRRCIRRKDNEQGQGVSDKPERGCEGSESKVCDGSNANRPNRVGRDCNKQVGRIGSKEKGERDVFQSGIQWIPEPELGRVAHGIPHRVERIRGLGNAVVPQIPQVIGSLIMQIENQW